MERNPAVKTKYNKGLNLCPKINTMRYGTEVWEGLIPPPGELKYPSDVNSMG